MDDLDNQYRKQLTNLEITFWSWILLWMAAIVGGMCYAIYLESEIRSTKERVKHGINKVSVYVENDNNR